jgi:6-phosphofructokinase
MAQTQRRIAINAGGGFVPGLDLVATGVVLAADRPGWEVLAIRNGYDGARAVPGTLFGRRPSSVRAAHDH